MLSSAERRLTAIMFTDVVGYGSMTQRNEELALELLQLHREMLRPMFRSYGGNEIKTMGDAFLVEFQSALQAARCAIAIQRELRQYNGSVAEERMIQVRIGLHIGDVVFESNDVYGDGVNLASRIYAQAQPGGIVITSSVNEQIYNKIDLPIRRMGPQRLKSIQKPVELYSIELDGRSVARFTAASKAGMALAVIIAVLAVAYALWGDRLPFGIGTPAPNDSLAVALPDTLTASSDSSEVDQPADSADVPPSDNTVRPPTNGDTRPPVEEQRPPSDPLSRFQNQYATLTSAENWYDLQLALRRGTDTGTMAYYASRDSIPSLEGTLVAVLDASATSASPVDAYLVYTNARFVNLETREEISTLAQRYSGKRVIWVRSLQ